MVTSLPIPATEGGAKQEINDTSVVLWPMATRPKIRLLHPLPWMVSTLHAALFKILFISSQLYLKHLYLVKKNKRISYFQTV